MTSFSTNQIDGSLLKELGADELSALDMNAFEVKKMLKFCYLVVPHQYAVLVRDSTVLSTVLSDK